jgi:hypothetical protein
MPNHIFSAPCLRVIQDKNKKLDSLIDIIESAAIPPGKKYIPRFNLYSKWVKTCATSEADKFEVKISTVSPSEKKKKKLQILSVDIPERSPGVTLILNLGTIKVEELGMWIILIEWKELGKKSWKKATELPIFLIEKANLPD